MSLDTLRLTAKQANDLLTAGEATSDEVFGALARERFRGRTEHELAGWVERTFREAGAEGLSFPRR